MAFINLFQQFVFDFSDSQDGSMESGLVSKKKRPPSLSAHEDAVRAFTPLPDRASNNNSNKVMVDNSHAI